MPFTEDGVWLRTIFFYPKMTIRAFFAKKLDFFVPLHRCTYKVTMILFVDRICTCEICKYESAYLPRK